MFIKTQEQNQTRSPEQLPSEAVTKQEEKKLIDALSLYLQSIKLNEAQPEWLYGNSITLSAQISRFDIGLKLKEKAEQLYQSSDEISRAIALLYEKQNKLENAIEYYQKSINLNPLQPEWVYTKVYDFLIKKELLQQAEDVRKQGIKYFPQATTFQQNALEIISRQSKEVDAPNTSISQDSSIRETPKSIEHNVDLNIEQTRRQLMDSSIVEKYEILLEQVICHVDGDKKQVDTNALIHCLAQVKTDIHYLKTRLLDPPASEVDPQAKQNVDIEKIVNSSIAIPIKCELKNRIVGSGWHSAERHGRWTGSGTFSSIVLPYPTAGEYRLEMIVRAEAKLGLLNTLRININDRPLAISTNQENKVFPAVVKENIVIESKNEPFLTIDLTIDETVNAQASDARLIGLLIEQITLIPIG